MPAGVSAYVALANVTLGSSAATVTMSSINQGYRDLVLVINAAPTAQTQFRLQFNSDTGSNYSSANMMGSGSSASVGSGNADGLTMPYAQSLVANNLFMSVINVLDYTATDKHKIILVRNNKMDTVNGFGTTDATAYRWSNTAAITSLLIKTGSGSIAAGSTFALYGIAS
jgi:hypothetical protein